MATKKSSVPHPLVVPGAIAVLASGGLISGLMGDGAWDAFAAFALAVPLIPIVRAVLRR